MLLEQNSAQPLTSPRVVTGEEMLNRSSPSNPPMSTSVSPISTLEYASYVASRPSILPRSATTPALSGSAHISTFSSMSQVSSSDHLRERPAPTTPTRNLSTSVRSISPTWTPKTTAEGKNWGRILDAFRGTSSSNYSVPTTPLPPHLDSHKAARLLGLTPSAFPSPQHFERTHTSWERNGDGYISDSSPASPNAAGSQGESYADLPVRRTVRRIASLPWLTRTQETVESRTHFEENERRFEDRGSHTTETAFQRFRNKNWKGANKKALEKLDIMPMSLNSRPKSSGRDRKTVPASGLDVQDEDAGYYSDGEPRSRHRSIPRLTPPRDRRTRHRRKGQRGQKPLDQMPPITEASSSDNVFLGVDGDNTKLEVISEYDVYTTKLDQSTVDFPTSYKSTTAPTLQGPFELGGVEVSGDIPQEGEAERGTEEGDEGEEVQGIQTATLLTLAAAQEILSATDHPELQSLYQYRRTLPQCGLTSESAPRYLPRSPLQGFEHILLNSMGKLSNIELRNEMAPEMYRLHESNGEMKRELGNIKRRNIRQHKPQSSDEDGNGPRSDADAENQWVIEEAVVVAFMHIAPGMVNVVYMPPKRANATGIGSEDVRTSNPDRPILLRDPTMRGGMGQSHELSSCSPYRSSGVAYRNLNRPPTPPPKDLSKVISEPLRSPKHHCIQNGHLFHAISLQTAPDKVILNPLQVSPFLVTSSGIKQHVKVPVSCENCGHDVKEQVWECEVPVCKLSVCYDCAVAMEEEWEGRVVRSWDRRPIKGMTA